MATVLTDIVPKGAGRNNQLGTVASAGINIFFIIYSILCVIPLLLIVAVSVSNEGSVVRNGYKFIPEQFDFAAYEFLAKDIGTIAHAYGVSILVTVIGTCLSMIIIALYAYPISRPNFPHAKFFTFFVFFTMLFSGGLVPWYLVYVQLLDLRNTILSLILPLIMAAFWVLVTRTFFQDRKSVV